jgi:hypothetical protein
MSATRLEYLTNITDNHNPTRYCRVLLGDAFHTNANRGNERRAPLKPGGSGVTYDSVVASGGAQVHREFIVYDRHQIYPEFIIYFKPT